MKPWAAWLRGPVAARDGAWVFGLALLARLTTVVWAAGRFPPADDGHFYHVVGERIARGLGYTWAWPDGAVTYAAHYPVGYPALIGGFYALFGSAPVVAMAVNAVIGAVGAWAVFCLAAQGGRRGAAWLAGGVAALHPGLVFYTPALMTEGVVAALLVVLALASAHVRERVRSPLGLVLVGLGAGVLSLLRPQALVLAPVFGALATRGPSIARLRAALAVTTLAVLTCLPWTLRNCARLDRCAFVSANGGWNLFIGSAEKATGAWVSIDELGVPEECRTVFGEADKDACFGRAGVRNVLEHPGHFLSLVPRKLAATFDWSGAPGHYLAASNSAAFDWQAKLRLGVVEAVVGRLVVLLGLVGLGFMPGPRPRLRKLGVALVVPFLFVQHAWVAYVALPFLVGLLGRALWQRPNLLFGAATVATTAATHAVFFGAGRYGLVCSLALVPFAVEGLEQRRSADAPVPG